MLLKLLYQGFGFWRLAGGLLGAGLGWTLLFGGMQFWFLWKQNLARQGDLLAPEYFIIHKPVPLINLLGQTGVAFTPEEIADLKKQSFVKDAAPFLANRFRAHAFFGWNNASPLLASDLFFEAVPDEFLDVQTDQWNWRPGADHLPIIIPRDFLTLYNFGFAQSQNLPQINEHLIHQLPFEIRITGQGKEFGFHGKIVGFTRRINSILVPFAFLRWANAALGEGQAQPAKLIVKAVNPALPQIMKCFSDKKYEYNTDQFRTAKLESALRLLLSVVAAFGLVVLILAFWIIALSFQLLITRNNERLRKLIWLGYPPNKLIHWYIVLIIAFVLLVNLGCSFLLAWGTGLAVDLFTRYEYPIEPVSLGKPLLGMLLLSVFIIVFNYFNLRQQIFRLI